MVELVEPAQQCVVCPYAHRRQTRADFRSGMVTPPGWQGGIGPIVTDFPFECEVGRDT